MRSVSVYAPGVTVEVINDPPIGGGGVPPSNALSTVAPGTARRLPQWNAKSNEAGDVYRTDYSCIVSDPARNRMLLFGGVHGLMGPNDVRALSLDAPAWLSLSQPTPVAQRVSSNVDEAHSRFISDGRHVAIHSYNSNVVLGDRLYAMAGKGWYDLATNQWSYFTTPPPYYYVSAACATPDGRILIAASGYAGNGVSEVSLYTPATGSFLKLGCSFGNVGTAAPSITYHPPSGRYYVYVYNGSAMAMFGLWLNAANPAASTCVPFPTTGPQPVGYCALDYDPVNGTIAGMRGGHAVADFHSLNVATRVWSKVAIQTEAGSAGAPQVSFHAGRFEPGGCYIACAPVSDNCATWAVRPA